MGGKDFNPDEPRDPHTGEWTDSPGGEVLGQLRDLAGKMAAAAQPIYDEWDQDDEGLDEEFGGGGICDAVAEALGGVISENLDVDVHEGGQAGDDHAYVLVWKDGQGYHVDLDHSVYERGGGMAWEKIPGANFDASDMVIEPLGEMPDPAEGEDW